MATHNGSNSNNTITVKDKQPAPGYNVSGTTNNGNFTATSLIVNGLGGNDTINLTLLTALSKVTSITINAGSGDDTINGSGLNDTIQVNNDESQFDLIQGNAGTDQLKVVGLWARFNTFNATSSGIEIFDATAKNVYGNGNANTLER